MKPGIEFSFNYAIDKAPTMEIRELIRQVALEMAEEKPTSQRQSRRERVPKTPKKIRK